MLRKLLCHWDLWAGNWVKLRHPAYIREQILTEGNGIYTRDEWTRARSNGYRGAGQNSAQLDSDESYLRRLLTEHAYNLYAALRLNRTFDFGSYQAVLEVGCGEMIQGFVTKTANPKLRYRATDFDPFVIEKCSRLPILADLEKSELDLHKITAADIEGFDLVLSWEVFYALDSANIGKLFQAAAQARASVLACTSQLTGPLRYFWRQLRNLDWRPDGFYYQRMVRRGLIRAHGWNATSAYYERIARHNGMKLTRKWHAPLDEQKMEQFSYLLFAPARS